MNVAELMVRGMGLELLAELAGHIETGLDTQCCVTGQPIREGIAWKRVIPSSTGEYLDLMHGMALPYMSVAAAAAFKGSWNMGSRLIFEDGTHWHPLISAEGASQSERTYWSALVREVWPARAGQVCVAIVAADFKKKVWPRALTGPLGTNTPVFVLDPDRHVCQSLTVNWERLIAVLDLVEMVYSAGFGKDSVAQGLYQSYAAFTQQPRQAIDWERELMGVRGLPEFVIAILIAQKVGRDGQAL